MRNGNLLLKRKFIIVEPHAQFRTLLRQMLKANGNRHQKTAENGKEAYIMLAEENSEVDFIVANWHMPHMNGLELLKKIRNDANYFNIPFLMVSSEGSQEKVACAMEEGADGYLVKPFNEEIFINTISDIGEKVANPTPQKKKMDEIRKCQIQAYHKKALKLGLELLKRKMDSHAMVLYTESLLVLEDYHNALMFLNKVTKMDSKNGKAYYLAGKIHLIQESFESAVKYLKKSVELNPFDADRKIDLARAYFRLGDQAAAEEAIQSILMEDTTELSFVAIADLYIERRELTKAGHYLQAVRKPIPETVHVFSKYAENLSKQGKMEEALKVFTRCQKIKPEDEFINFNLGVIHSKRKHYDEAIKQFDKVLALNPDHPTVHALKNFARQNKNKTRSL